MKRIANFLFEAGMLKRTPRTGFQFLGSGAESVAEHIFRTVYIGYTLGHLSGDVDTDKIVKMCLFHDLPEARTGDLNYVNKKYVKADEKKAVNDLTAALPFGREISDVVHEFLEGRTQEARLAYDADQLEMILALKEYKDVGNQYADEWLDFALKRLKTDIARELSRVIMETDSSLWWFSDKSDWWINGKKSTKKRFTRLRQVKAKNKTQAEVKVTVKGKTTAEVKVKSQGKAQSKGKTFRKAASDHGARNKK